ncbi:MAG: hypothetical protein EU529_11045 [Promethearchaeota archaeon]|nr:MAG: hypothetical protein EU529_11045 [Candidatus Lokiarchaeota archaeon]
MSKITEEELEIASLDILRDIGYSIKFGPDISPSGIVPERNSYREIFLKERFYSALNYIILKIFEEIG